MNRLVYKTNIVKAYLRSQCIGSCERNIAINGLEPRLCLFSTRRDEGQSGSEKKKKKGSEDESSVASKKLSEKANTFIKFAERVRRSVIPPSPLLTSSACFILFSQKLSYVQFIA